jgi:NAD(P)H-hydrate epimerase
LLLMENAGRNAAASLTRAAPNGSALIVCGPGNNGGDGFVLARQLLAQGRDAHVLLLGHSQRLKGDAAVNHGAWCGVGGTVTELGSAASRELVGRFGVIVDGLFGTGLDRPLVGDAAALVQLMNDAPAFRLALDVPSGLDANTGAILGTAVRAHRTVTFGAYKLGLLTPRGADLAGQIEVVDIGVPESLFDATGWDAEAVHARDIARLLTPRARSVHKGGAGRVTVFAGSAGKIGAALLVARGALRSGAGLVTIATHPDAADALDRRVLEEMTARLDPENLAQAIDDVLTSTRAAAIGPGLGLDARARAIVDRVVLGWDGPKVVDADALTLLKGRAAELRRAPGQLLLTPHPSELARLLGRTTEEVEADRFGAAREAAELTGAVVLLKGAHTLVARPGTRVSINMTGSPALATAGSGDVLSGVAAALACTLSLWDAALVAAHAHGSAGERWSCRSSADRGLLAHEIAEELPAVLAALRTSA